MKFIVSSGALLKKLQIVGGVLNASNTLPVLDNFLFEISDGQLTISASDLESTYVSKVQVEAKEDGAVTIPARLLLDILKAFPEQPITFTIDQENMGIELSSDNGKYKLVGQSASEFPKMPEVDSPTTLTCNSMILGNAINKTIFASGNDDLRPVMSGVFFELDSNEVTFVATDAHKLVKYGRQDVQGSKTSSFIMPKKPLHLLKSVLPTIDEDVTIEYNETNARFTFDDSVLISRLIDGKYPNYNAVIPTENPHRLTIDRETFLSAVKRVSIFSNKTTHQVRLKITGSELNISAEDQDFSNEATERLTCSYEGEDMEIGFNSRFLMEMLNNLTSTEVCLELSAPNRAGILTPAEKDDDQETLIMLVMPVMLNN